MQGTPGLAIQALPSNGNEIISLENNHSNIFHGQMKSGFEAMAEFDEIELEDYEMQTIFLDSKCSCSLHANRRTVLKNIWLFEDYRFKKQVFIEPEISQAKLNSFNPSNMNIEQDEKIKERKQFPCNECDDIFDTRPNLIIHLKATHGSKIICKYCKKVYTLRTNLKRHQDYFCIKNENKQKNNEKLKYGMFSQRLICDYCKKSYTHKNSLMKHIQSHMGKDMKFQCDLCNKKYTKKFNLICHLQSKHYKLYRFSCKYCKSKFAWRWAVISHQKNHHYLDECE